MIDVTHIRTRWTSRNGVELVDLQYSTYPAKSGYTDIRYAYIDLADYDMDLVIKHNYTVTRIAVDAGAELALNGPFATITADNAIPIGHVVKDGKLIQSTVSADLWADFILRKNGNMEIGQINPRNISDIVLGFSSTPQIVKGGQIYVNVWGEKTPADVYASRRPRTGLGITKDGRVLVVVVDGDSSYDAGLRVDELAAVMIELGAVEAINLDGGGSSCMVQHGQPITPNKGTRRLGAALVFKPKESFNVPGYSYRIAHIDKRPNTRPGGSFKPEVLLIHTTNNFNSSATAEAHRRLLNQTKDYVSYHLVTDSTESIELIPLHEPGYHSGDGGNGYYTRHSIGHEICVNKMGPDGKLDPQTYRNAVETSARIVAKYNVEVKEHRDVPERAWKNCTHKDVMDFTQFKRDVMARAAQLRGDEPADKPEQPKKLYRVQVGAFSVKENAERLANELQTKGYQTIIKEELK